MDTNNFFHWIGEKLGAAIRFIVDGLEWLFDGLYGAMDSFIHGLTSSLGISLSLLSLAFEPAADPQSDPGGHVLLTLAGDGAIRVQVEALEVSLRDVTRPYLAPSGKTPQHPD